MVSSRAWFALAVAGVLGLFYVGEGLREDAPGMAIGRGRVAFGQEATAAKRIKWERIEGHGSGLASERPPQVLRAKIPGGWLVETARQAVMENGVGLGVGLAFVPDPTHKWDGNSLP